MSAREQTCEQSKHADMSHNWEFEHAEYPCGEVILFDFRCDYCKKRKWVMVEPDAPFDQAMYWEADE